MENKGEIYLITCKCNGKRYVGQAVCFVKCSDGTLKKNGLERRWKTHLYTAKTGKDDCYALSHAIRKYGYHNFSIKPLVICDVSQLNHYEHKMARYYKSYTPNGYNIRQCSSNGRHTLKSKLKMSASKTGEKHHMYGKHHSDETKAKISLALARKVTQTKELKIVRPKKHLKLPMYIQNYTDNGLEGYRVKTHPFLPDRKFVAACLTMEQKLQQAEQYITDGIVPANKSSYIRDEKWKDKASTSRQISKTLPKYIYITNNNIRDIHGYQVKNHPILPRKHFISNSLSMSEKLELAIKYLSNKENSSENK